MEQDILHEINMAWFWTWLMLNRSPNSVSILIDGQPYDLSEFVKNINAHVKAEAYEQARSILENNAADLRVKMMRLLQIGEEVEQVLCREVRKVLPEAIHEEDYQ